MQIYYINNNWYKNLYQKFSTKISTYGRDGVGVGALMLWPCVRYHQRMRQRAILKFNTKLVHKNWNCKFLSRKTQKRKYTPVGGFSRPWGWIVLPKHFMRLNGVFRWNLTISEGLQGVGMNECCTSTPGCRPHLGGVCAYFDTKHKGSRCLTWKFTPVRCLFNVEMKYNRNLIH